MKVRCDLVFISSVLLTIGLLCLVPASLLLVSCGIYQATLMSPAAGFWTRAQMGQYFGVASLTIVLCGLIVIWAGYAKRSRSAWLVMFAVTWVWIFPVFVLPALKGARLFVSLPDWVYDVISWQDSPQSGVQWAMIFSLILVAFLLPLKSFFLVRDTSAQNLEGRSHKLIRRSSVTLLMVLLAFMVGIHNEVDEIPLKDLNAWRIPPVPPPPPTPFTTASELTVEQVVTAPPFWYAHRLIRIRGCYVLEFELNALESCRGDAAIWIEDAKRIHEEEQVYQRHRRDPDSQWSEPLEAQIHRSSVFVFPYDEAKNRLAWRKLSQVKSSEVTLVGQFETLVTNARTGNGGFGHLGGFTELILVDVL